MDNLFDDVLKKLEEDFGRDPRPEYLPKSPFTKKHTSKRMTKTQEKLLEFMEENLKNVN